jgi:hypothetical protein
MANSKIEIGPLRRGQIIDDRRFATGSDPSVTYFTDNLTAPPFGCLSRRERSRSSGGVKPREGVSAESRLDFFISRLTNRARPLIWLLTGRERRFKRFLIIRSPT